MTYVEELENVSITMVILTVRYSWDHPGFWFYSSDSVHVS